jgi:hypothetical protein
MNPFKFLDPFEKKDAALFFGREKETAQLWNAVHASNLTLVYGASGTGKTSLVQCGLASKFYDSDWLPLFIRHRGDFEASLHASLDAALNLDPQNEADVLMASRPAEDKLNLIFVDHFKPVYLLFDQFEEIYIIGEPEKRKALQHAFYQALKSILEKPNLHVKIVIIIREEWIAHLNEFEKTVPYLFDNRLRVEHMNTENLFNFIGNTLHYAHIPLETPDETIDLILENIRDTREGIELTNLQVYLDRLYREGSKIDRLIFDLPLVNSVGKMENVISDFLDEELTKIEYKLENERKISKPKGLPMEILFKFTTDNGTKKPLTTEALLAQLPEKWVLSTADIEFCLSEFKRIRVLRETE